MIKVIIIFLIMGTVFLIGIPSLIKNTCKENKISNQMISCLRGIIDTDFYLYSSGGQVALGAWFASEKLVLDLVKYFNLLGIDMNFKTNLRYYNTSAKKYLIRHYLRTSKKGNIKKD